MKGHTLVKQELTTKMRLDTILSVAMGLSAIQSTFVYGFSSSSYLINGEPKSTLISKSCYKHCLSPQFLFTNNNNNNNLQQRQYCNSRIRQTQLSSKIGNDDDDVVDAIVEEKTAGLALDDEEENTSVRCDQISLLLFCIYMFSHVCSRHSYITGVSIRVYPLS